MDFACIFFLGLSFSALLGKFTWGRKFEHDAVTEDEIKIVLGATLSLFGLLIGFILSFAIGGYNARVAAEENEAIAIGNAFHAYNAFEGEPPRASEENSA